MSDVNELLARIDGVMASARGRDGRHATEPDGASAEREKRRLFYETAQARVVAVARPRLQALASRLGQYLAITPSVFQTRRAVRFEYQSPRVCITLTFSVAPDRELKNVVVGYDLDIDPVLVDYESHLEFTNPVDRLDTAGLAHWLDDRIVGFVELFLELYNRKPAATEYATDPVAHVQFPRSAAAASLEYGGQKYFFIDEKNKQDFVRQKGIAAS